MAWYYARHSQEDADDLLQEAWIGLLEALGELDLSIGNPEQYLILRARWRLLDAIKHARRRSTLLDDLFGVSFFDDDECHPSGEYYLSQDYLSQEAERIFAEFAVAEFAAHLKPLQQTVLWCLIHGLTWRETGCVLDCTSANIAYHVRQIRKLYEKWDEERTL